MSVDLCYEPLAAILFPLAKTNSQLPLLIFSEPNCTGSVYPPAGGLLELGARITRNDVGFESVRSLYVPPHVTLQVWSGAMTHYFAVIGPAIVPDTSALIAAWGYRGDLPCPKGQGICGQKVDFRLGPGEAQIGALTLLVENWQDFLANAASAQIRPALGPLWEFPFDFDAFMMKEYCAADATRAACGCVNAYQDLLQNHPLSVNDSYINIMPNSCNPLTQYVPTGARIGVGSKDECLQMIRAQLNEGTFQTAANGGPSEILCNYFTIPNDGQVANTTSALLLDAQATNEANILIYVLVAVLAAVLVLIMIRIAFRPPAPPAAVARPSLYES